MTPLPELLTVLPMSPALAQVRRRTRTVSGLIMDQLRHIPTIGERFILAGLQVEIVDMDGQRIDKVLVQPTTPPEAADDTSAIT